MVLTFVIRKTCELKVLQVFLSLSPRLGMTRLWAVLSCLWGIFTTLTYLPMVWFVMLSVSRLIRNFISSFEYRENHVENIIVK